MSEEIIPFKEGDRAYNPLPRDSMVTGILKNPDEILFEDDFVYVITNIYPICPGSCMVIPKRYVEDMNELSGEEAKALLSAIEKTSHILEEAYNLPCMTLKYHGSHTTQDHLHFHVMPTDLKYRDLYYEAKDLRTEKMPPEAVRAFHKRFSSQF